MPTPRRPRRPAARRRAARPVAQQGIAASEMPTASSRRAGAQCCAMQALQDPADLLGIARVVEARREIEFARAAAEVRHHALPAARRQRDASAHGHSGCPSRPPVHGTSPPAAHRARWHACPVEVDEVPVGRAPALAPEADLRTAREARRDDGLGMAVAQPPGHALPGARSRPRPRWGRPAPGAGEGRMPHACRAAVAERRAALPFQCSAWPGTALLAPASWAALAGLQWMWAMRQPSWFCIST